MTASAYTQDFARKIGFPNASPAMLKAFEDIRQSGIRRARQAHFERIKVIEQFKAEPGMFFASIRPSLCTEEAIEDARRIRFQFRSLPTYLRGEYRLNEARKAALTEIYARYFRRFGRRIWIREAA